MTFIGKIQRLKNRKGFTLVELVIAMAVMSIILAAAFAMLDPVNKIIKALKGDVEVHEIVNTVENYIISQISDATDLVVLRNVNIDDATDVGDNGQTVAETVYDFQWNHKGQNDDPRMMVIKPTYDAATNEVTATYIYNIRLNTMTWADAAAVATFLTSDANLRPFRVFNQSYFSGVALVITPYIGDGKAQDSFHYFDDAGNHVLDSRGQVVYFFDMTIAAIRFDDQKGDVEYVWGNYDKDKGISGGSDSLTKFAKMDEQSDGSIGRMEEVFYNGSANLADGDVGTLIILYDRNAL